VSLNFNERREDQVKPLINQELQRILKSIFESSKKILNGLNEIKTINGWYKEAKEDPHKIPGIILDQCISKIIEHVQPDLDRYFIDTFKVKIRSNKGGFVVDSVELEFSIKPYVKFVRRVDEIESGITKLTFEVSLTGKMENIQFCDVMNHYRVTVGKLSSSFDISILNGSITVQYVTIHPIKKPIKLYHKEVLKLENLTFTM